MRHVSCPVCGGVQGVASLAAIPVQCAFCRVSFLVPPAQSMTPPPVAGASQATPPILDAQPQERPAASRGFIPRGMMLEFTFFGLFAVIFLAGLIVVLLVTGRWKIGTAGSQPRVEEIVVVRNDEPTGELRWSNASRISLQLDGVKTRIDHVEYREVFARDDQRRVVTTTNSYLTIWVHLENFRKEPADYRSWYGNRFERAGRSLEAKLVDSRGIVYPQKKFDDVHEVKGHITQATLAMKDVTRDTIVFEVPEGLRRSDVVGFQLELPGAAFGGEGFLRFEIPLGLVEGW